MNLHEQIDLAAIAKLHRIVVDANEDEIVFRVPNFKESLDTCFSFRRDDTVSKGINCLYEAVKYSLEQKNLQSILADL